MEKYLKLPVIMSMENKFIQIRNTYLQWTVDVDKSSSVCEPVTAVISEKCQGFPPIANRFQWNVLWITISRGAQYQNIKVKYAEHMLDLRIWLIVLKGTLSKCVYCTVWTNSSMENKAFILRHLFLLLLLQTFDPGCSFNLEKVSRFANFFLTTSQSVPVFPSF